MREGMVLRSIVNTMGGVFAAILLAGCTTGADDETNLASNTTSAPEVVQPAVIQGACPRVSLRDGTSYFRTYEDGGENDPSRIVHQVALADTTRQCILRDDNIIVNVVAAGRLVAGPAGGPGEVEMPIRVAAVQNNAVIFSELEQYKAILPEGSSSTQFLYNRAEVVIPRSAAASTEIFVGFDEGPYDTP